MLTQLHWIRAFEEAVLELAAEGLVHGPAHSSVGQEGGAVGSVLALGAGDQINGSHRGHHQFLAKALQHVAPQGLDPRNPINAAVDEVLQRTLAEIMGLAQGYCRGRGGSMHLRWLEAGALGTNAIVGGGVPLAAGAGWAHKHAGTDRVAVTYFGDGAVNIGSVLETMNLTAAWKTPLCFFIENNRYAVSTTVEESTRRTAPVGARPGLQHPVVAGGRHGSAGRVPGHVGSRGAHARRQGSYHRRSGRVPLLPPERPFPAAPSATAARTRKRNGAAATRWTRSPPR